MVRGFFIGNTPWVQIVLAYGYSVQTPFVILDTGFTGDLQVTPKIARELGLRVTGITPVRTATGRVDYVPTAVAVATMEGIANYVQVLITNGFPLAGISFLVKFRYRALVNYHGLVLLQRA
jgi:predicted aspartyl protease